MSIVKSPILDQVTIRFREWFPLKKIKNTQCFLNCFLKKEEDFILQIKLTRTFAWILRI